MLISVLFGQRKKSYHEEYALRKFQSSNHSQPSSLYWSRVKREQTAPIMACTTQEEAVNAILGWARAYQRDFDRSQAEQRAYKPEPQSTEWSAYGAKALAMKALSVASERPVMGATQEAQQ